MGALETIGMALGLFVVLLLPLFLLYSLIKWIWESFVDPPRVLTGETSEGIKIDQLSIENILFSKFAYYKKLDAADRQKFLKRTAKFILNKEFRAMKMELTEEMMVLISASAIQLTFGLDEYLLDHFNRIFIYPREFSSRTSKQLHKGETNLAGAIVLSWKHFNEGYANSKDNLNLGLHEMAHALKFNKIGGFGPEQTFSEYMDKWMMIAKDEFVNLRNKGASSLREYGGTNATEFFSVCVEYFFESPEDFKNKLPEIYKHLCILLNQDPAAGISNYGKNQSRSEETLIENSTPLLEFANQNMNIWVAIASNLVGLSVLVFILIQNPETWKKSGLPYLSW
jgi:hypothetical protein